jgi:M6 family metalloprotease-like protein
MVLGLAWGRPAVAAPFAKTISFTQPDSTVIELWGEGDEFHAVFETLDGYTVVFNPRVKAYEYAERTPGGDDLVPSGLLVGRDLPAKRKIEKHLRINAESRSKKARARYLEWEKGMEVEARWREIKEARRLAESAAMADADGGSAPGVLAPPSFTTTGTKVGLTLLIDFDNDPATVAQAEIVNFCNGENYTGYGNNGSVKKYFQDNSNGLLTYSNVVTVYIRIPNSLHPKSWYNDTTKGCGDQGNLLIRDAIGIMTNLPNYTTTILPMFNNLTVDGNNRIIACNVFYAGGNGGVWAKGLWPHSWSLYNVGAQYLSPGGKRVYKYQITDIGSSLELGTFCHENGHMLCGYPDIYDYQYDSVGGAGGFCLMNSGGHGVNPVQINAYLKRASGWVTTLPLTSASNLTASLTASAGPNFNKFYRYQKPGVSTEYFLLENRQKTGRDANISASGIAIWHVDELGDRDNQSLVSNTTHANYELSLIQADNLWHFQNNVNSGDSKDLYYSGNTAAGYNNTFSDTSSPDARWWDGSNSGANFRNFSASGATMTFDVGNTAVTITGNPQSRTNNPGTAASFTVTASGAAPLFYQWQKNATNISLATNATYTMASVTGNDAGSYRCRVSNSVSVATSAVATLTVNSVPVFNPLGVQTVLVGSAKTFVVSATSTPAPVLALRSTSTSSNYDFAPQTGELTYTPPPADTGSKSFTFIASNSAGVATQTIAVAVEQPFSLAITHPTGSLTVANGVTNYTVVGMAGASMVGQLKWTNQLTGAIGQGPAHTNWQLAIGPLAVGTNTLFIAGTNQPSPGGVVATDAAVNAVYSDGWTTGDKGGTSFNSWILSTNGGAAGYFRATSGANSRLNIGGEAWGLWAHSGSEANAYRLLGRTLQSGDTVRVTFENNWVNNGASVGISLCNADGQYLVEFFFVGGASTYTINDAILGRNTGIGYTDTGQGVALTLTGPSNYRLVAGSTTLSGSLASRPNMNITRFRAWNYNAGSGEDYNVYFNYLSITSSPAAASSTSVTAQIVRQPAPPSISQHPTGFVSVWGVNTALVVAASGDPPLRLQWTRDGSPLSGATNATLAFAPLARADEGAYRVIISNAVGAATSEVAAVTVNKADQALTFPNPGDQVATNQLTLSAAANSGLTVAFSLLSGPALVSGSNVAFTGEGEVSIAADQPGDNDWNPAASVTNTVMVSRADPGIVWTNPAPILYGALLSETQLNASASVAGSFDYSPAAGALLNAGTNALTAAFTPVDTARYHTVTAAVVLVILPAPQNIVFENPGAQVITSVVALAAAASSGLPVEFGVSGPASVNAFSNLTFSATGWVEVVANQPGNTNWLAAPPVTHSFAVAAFADANTNNIPDVWEVDNFGSLDLVTEISDYDEDGMLDWQEFVAGTKPTNAGSRLSLEAAPLVDSDNQIIIQWSSVSNRLYAVGRKSSMVDPFLFFTSGLPAYPPLNIYTDAPPGEGPWYYQIKAWLEP